jgi:hypothetical protein
MSDAMTPKTPEQELISERIDKAAEAFSRALLKHPLLRGMILKQMMTWKIPTNGEGNVDAMIDAVARHLNMQRATGVPK